MRHVVENLRVRLYLSNIFVPPKVQCISVQFKLHFEFLATQSFKPTDRNIFSTITSYLK